MMPHSFGRRAAVQTRPQSTMLGASLVVTGILAAAAVLYWFQPSWGTLAGWEHTRTFAVPAIPGNLSGVTYCPESDTLFLVSNRPARVYEITRKGRLLRRIDLVGFYDTEDIVYIENQTFGVIEERRETVIVFPIQADTRVVNYTDCREIAALPSQTENNGLEGLTWDPRTRKLLVAREDNPRAIYRIAYEGPRETAIEISTLRNLPWIHLGDYAAIHFDAATCRLLILSRTSGKIKDYTLGGREKGSLNLLCAIPGISKAEGLAFVPGGELYISSEPNRIDVFRKKRASAGAMPILSAQGNSANHERNFL